MSKVHEFMTLWSVIHFTPSKLILQVYFTSEATSHGYKAAILSPGITDCLYTWGMVKMILSAMTTTPTWHDSAGVWCGSPKLVIITHFQVGPVQPSREIFLN